jgi:membrane protein
MWKRWQTFIEQDLWRLRIRALPRRRFLLFRALRIGFLALRRFTEDRCQLHASALTFYSLLSLVPTMAMAFGVAVGFGLDQQLRALILERLRGQEEVAGYLIGFSQELLNNTRGSVIAGFGVALLGWAAIKLLGQIEASFNDIWGVRRGRTFERRIADYLAVIVICPILLVLSSSATVLITARVIETVQGMPFLGPLEIAVQWLLSLLPFVVLWVLFTFVYVFMPNTRVSWRAALIAGVTAGTLYQAVQWAYIAFQIGVSHYNAVYGSFAALPLFLMWLQASWLIVLFGAEISFAVDNVEKYELERESLAASPRVKRALALRLAQLCAQAFERGDPPASTPELAHQLDAPIRLVREQVDALVQAGVLTQVQGGERGDERVQPARDPHLLTVKSVLDALDNRGEGSNGLAAKGELEGAETVLKRLDEAAAQSKANVPLSELE